MRLIPEEDPTRINNYGDLNPRGREPLQSLTLLEKLNGSEKRPSSSGFETSQSKKRKTDGSFTEASNSNPRKRSASNLLEAGEERGVKTVKLCDCNECRHGETTSRAVATPSTYRKSTTDADKSRQSDIVSGPPVENKLIPEKLPTLITIEKYESDQKKSVARFERKLGLNMDDSSQNNKEDEISVGDETSASAGSISSPSPQQSNETIGNTDEKCVNECGSDLGQPSASSSRLHDLNPNSGGFDFSRQAAAVSENASVLFPQVPQDGFNFSELGSGRESGNASGFPSQAPRGVFTFGAQPQPSSYSFGSNTGVAFRIPQGQAPAAPAAGPGQFNMGTRPTRHGRPVLRGRRRLQ